MRKDIQEKTEEINGFSEVKVLAESIKNLSKSAFLIYKPMVDDICSRRTVSEKELEHILDGLYYREVYKDEGIRIIYGMSGVDSISVLEKMISFLEKKYRKKGKWITTKRCKTIYYDESGKEIDVIDAIMNKVIAERKEEIEFEVSEGDTSDYWLDTAANAMRPLHQLIALAKMCPDCIWDGD